MKPLRLRWQKQGPSQNAMQSHCSNPIPGGCHLLYLRNMQKRWKWLFFSVYTNFRVVLHKNLKEKSLIIFIIILWSLHNCWSWGRTVYFESENDNPKYLSKILWGVPMPSLLCSSILWDDIHSGSSYYKTWPHKYDNVMHKVISYYILWNIQKDAGFLYSKIWIFAHNKNCMLYQ